MTHQQPAPGSVTLRPVGVDDIDDEYVAWYRNDDGHLDYFSGSGRVFDRDALLADRAQGLAEERWFYYLIESDGHRLGTVRIGPIDRRNRTSDLVCLIGNRAFAGRGYGSKAVAAASERAFDEHGIRRLHSGMYETNQASVRAYVKGGWHVEARMRGFYLVGGQAVDRICVACLNPRYFDADGSDHGA